MKIDYAGFNSPWHAIPGALIASIACALLALPGAIYADDHSNVYLAGYADFDNNTAKDGGTSLKLKRFYCISVNVKHHFPHEEIR